MYDVVIIGGGPGGYAAALYAHNFGLSVALVEKDLVGGVCLHSGCVPTKAWLETAATFARVAGAGDFGVLAGHAPVVAAIRPGILTITTGGKHEKIIVLGGVAEVSEKGLTVLANVATSLAELDRAQFAETIAEMEEGLKEKEGDELDNAIARLDHFKSIHQQLSSTAMH